MGQAADIIQQPFSFFFSAGFLAGALAFAGFSAADLAVALLSFFSAAFIFSNLAVLSPIPYAVPLSRHLGSG